MALVTVDSYSESNYTAIIYDIYLGYSECGQSFTGNGGILNSVKFYVLKSGAPPPTGNVYAKIYSHTGTFGSTGKPGTLLATSDAKTMSSIPAGLHLESFTFSDANKILLTNGTRFIAVLASANTGGYLNCINAGGDKTSSTHTGNICRYTDPPTDSWASSATWDLCFYVYSDNPDDPTPPTAATTAAISHGFVLKDAAGKYYEFNNCTERAWEWYENDVGRCRFFVPYSDLKLTATSIEDNAFSEINIYREGTLVWQGFVQMIQDGINGCWIYGETYMAALNWYGVRYDQAYTAASAATIISDEYDNILTRSDDFLAAKITKGTIETPLLYATSTTLPVTRTFYNESLFSVLRDLTALARSQEQDPDTWGQNTTFNISFSETAPTFSFLRNVGQTRSNTIFELDSEILDFNFVTDLRAVQNYFKAFTVASGPVILSSTQTNAVSSAKWYRREGYPFYPNLNSQADLDKIVDRLDLEWQNPFVTMSLKFAAGLKPLDGYNIGDRVKIRIKRGRVDIDEYRRVVGIQVNIDNTGVETTTPVLQRVIEMET